MGVPILKNHGPDVIGGDLGSLSPVGGKLFFEFDAPITREMFFEIFPTAGARFTEVEIVGDVMMVKSGEILEFSLIDKGRKMGMSGKLAKHLLPLSGMCPDPSGDECAAAADAMFAAAECIEAMAKASAENWEAFRPNEKAAETWPNFIPAEYRDLVAEGE